MKTEEQMIAKVFEWFKSITPESQAEFKNLKESELIGLHHSLGRNIRNEFGMWESGWIPFLEDGIDISLEHPDNKSMRIITEVWKRVQRFNYEI